MCSELFVLVCLACISFAECNLAPFITKCKWDDSKCLKETSQKAIPRFAAGIPELNVEPLDPVTLKFVDASTPNLKFTVSDVVVTGLKNCEAKKVQRDIEKSKLSIKMQCTSCHLDGKYDMKGQLLIIPIEGNGAIHVFIRKIIINVDGTLIEKDGKDGKKHFNVKSWGHTFDLKEESDVNFENLFPNNEFLRKTTNDLIDKNGNEVIKEIGAPIIKAVVVKVIESAKNFFEKVPTEELAVN